jgi:hypothetical protein
MAGGAPTGSRLSWPKNWLCEEDERTGGLVVDDGAGGAQIGAGSGLGGLGDRIEALGGAIR